MKITKIEQRALNYIEHLLFMEDRMPSMREWRNKWVV